MSLTLPSFDSHHIAGNLVQYAIITPEDFRFFYSESEMAALINVLTRSDLHLKLEVNYLLLLDYNPVQIQAFFERLLTLEALTEFYIFSPLPESEHYLLQYAVNQNTQIIINGLEQLRLHQINVDVSSQLPFLQENDPTPPSSPSPRPEN